MGIQALNIPQRLALLSDGSTVPITNLFDALGDETTDPAEAVAFVCGRSGHWLCDLIANFETVLTH
jgi:LDH2 family malate/lactate/ureidoglycolate dehydrogenase